MKFILISYIETSVIAWSETNEQHIKVKILAKDKLNNINIINNIKKCYLTETQNYNKNLSTYRNYIKIAEVTEIALSSIATTAKTTLVALTGIEVPYSVPEAVATATICGSLSKTLNTN